MSKAKAVYTDKRAITAGKLAALAKEAGIELRYLQLGGYTFFRYADQVPKKGLTSPLNKNLLVVGARDGESNALAELDAAISIRDHQRIGNLLNSFVLPWVELYSSRFDYKKDVAANPARAEKRFSSLQPQQLQRIEKATVRYIAYNQSGQKTCGDLMKQLAAVLESHVDGIAVAHKYVR